MESASPVQDHLPRPLVVLLSIASAPALRNGTYDRVDELLSDTVGILGELDSDAASAGASCLQFDEPACSFLVAPEIDEMIAAMGSTADRLMESSVVTDRRFLKALLGDVTTAVHLCRGNYASRHISSGSLEPVAESLFSLPFDRFLIEREEVEREGDFSALSALDGGDGNELAADTQWRKLEVQARVAERVWGSR